MTWRRFFRRPQRDAEAARDLAFYLETEIEDNLARGLTLAEARAAAHHKLGNPGVIREEIYRMNSFTFLDGLAWDARLALRNMRRNPAFTTTAVLALALGIGANAAIFSLFYDLLLRPLPYRNPAALFSVGREVRGLAGGLVAGPEFVGWRVESRTLEGMAAWTDGEFNWTGQGPPASESIRLSTPERLQGAMVTADFLGVLGVQPALGRGCTASEGRPGAPSVVLLSHELWQRRFGGDSAILGRSLVLNGAPYTVAGVLPIRFHFPANCQPEILVAFQLPAEPIWNTPSITLVNVIARARPGGGENQVAADLSAVSARHQSQMPIFYSNPAHPSRIIAEQLVGRSRAPLAALLWSVAALLLLACVNVANLQLARAGVRQREIGLRAALGAGRGRLVQWLVAENLVLSGMAGVAGLAVAYLLLGILKASRLALLQGPRAFDPGWVLWAATFALSLAVGLLAGLLPAAAAAKVQLHEVLKSGAAAVLGGRRARARAALVSSQVALALVLLMGSGLLLRSLQRVLAVDWGFQPDGLLAIRMRLLDSRYSTPAKQRTFAAALLDRVSGLPAVESAAVSSSLPLMGYGLGGTVLFEGQPVPPVPQRPSVPILAATPGYFSTMRTPLLAGRYFSAADDQDTMPVAIVNATFARRFYAAGDALGKRIQLGGQTDYATIVGIAADIRHSGREADADPQVFQPWSQRPAGRVNLVVRSRTNPLSLVAAVRAAVWEIDREQPIYGAAAMDEMIRESGANRTMETWLLTSFGLLALALAAIGIYGVVSEWVNQRRREIGLRIALGAQAGDVLRSVLGRGMALTSAGIAAGAVAGWYLARFLQSLLFGIPPRDAVAFGGAGLLLLAVAMGAAYLPARRAARLDPVETLRCE